MRAATAYFAGIGTVVVAVAAGLGGGLLLGDIMSPQQPKHPSSEVTRLEQRNSPQPIPAANGASQPVPYMGPTQIANTVAEQQTQQTQPSQAQSPQAQPVQQASTGPAEPKPPAEQSTPAQPAAALPAVNAEQRAAPEDSLAKARDADLKRDDRRAEEKRKAERRAEKRKWRQRRDDDMRDVEASVREDGERRSFFGRNEPRFERAEPRPLFGGGPGFGRSFSPFDD